MAMPRVGTGHAINFWVIQYLKTMNLNTETKYVLKIKNQKESSLSFCKKK
jgi:hypothetical protein